MLDVVLAPRSVHAMILVHKKFLVLNIFENEQWGEPDPRRRQSRV